MKQIFLPLLTLSICASCAPTQESQTTATTTATATTTQESQEPKAVVTKSAPAIAQTVLLTESFTSEIKAYKENDIIPAASGVRIDKILFDVGDKVQKGDVVATLDPTLYEQQMISVNNLQADYDRLKPVYDAGGISRQTLDQAKSVLDVQREIAANIKKNIELTSPISGVVTQRNAEAGDLFTQQAILHISQIDKLKVLVDISEQYFPSVKVGMDVKLKLDIYPDDEFSGRVSLIHPALNAESRTFTAEVTVPNTQMKLRPGMYVHSTFTMGSKDGIMIPDIAIQKQFGSSEYFVYLVEDGKATRHNIQKGRQVGSLIDIISGVEVGDEIITTAFSRLDDGTAITIK